MYDNEFFVVDMASCTSTGEIINSLSLALETLNHSGKKIVLKLNDTKLNQPQLLSIQSLIASYGCSLDTVETTNKETAEIAESMNIFIQEPIEKRIEEKYSEKKEEIPPSIGFEQFGLPKQEDNMVKEVTGLHFEANLDVIQKEQEQIDISNDLKNAGIDPAINIKAVEAQAESIYNKPEDIINNVNDYAKMTTPNMMIEEEIPTEIQDSSKKSIGVYKKAYNEDETIENDKEEIEFNDTPTDEAVVSDSKITTYVNQNLRSGQILESSGNVVVIGDCHPGSEIRATGDITVWGVLSGIAHAGYNGNNDARVRALKLNAVQLRIGNCYSRRPDGSNIPYIIRSSIFTPEEARVVNNEIMLFKINQN